MYGVYPEIYAQPANEILVYIDQIESRNEIANVRDSSELTYAIRTWTQNKIREGYLLAGLDSIRSNALQSRIYLHQGRSYNIQWQQKSSDTLLLSSRWKVTAFERNQPDSILLPDLGQTLDYYSNMGHPFAQLRIDTAHQLQENLFLELYIDKGPYVYFTQAEQRNEQVLKSYVLNRIIGIYPGQAYSDNKYKLLQEKLRRAEYIKQDADPRIFFLGTESKIWLYLKKEKRSRFDLLLGVNSFEGPAGRQYRLTGQAGVDLINGLKLGERFYLDYENLNENAPKFKMGIDFPFLPFGPFGLSMDFGVFRFAEEYIDLSYKAAIDFKLYDYQKLALHYSWFSSGLLNPDTLSLKLNKRLPSILDFNYKAYGLHYSFNTLEHPVNPRSGSLVALEIQYGTKSYPRNSGFTQFDSDSIQVNYFYDSLDQNRDQIVFLIQSEFYQAIFSRSVLKFLTEYKSFFGRTKILRNEMFRLGGFKKLRGFDDDFLYCEAYVLGTIEYRFLLDKEAYLNVFCDAAYLKQHEGDKLSWNYYTGVGAGIQFQTKIGLFSLNYAVGQSKFQKFDFGNGKIHFGYAALF